MLAGSLIVNEGDVPGRPPGADLEIIIDGRAAASNMIKSLSIAKEKAMKTAFITLLLAVVVLLGPPMMVTGESAVAVNNQSTLNIARQDHATAQPLTQAEMNAAVGGAISGCFQSIDASGDVYGTCCVNLWIFTICVSVNESAIERTLSSIF